MAENENSFWEDKQDDFWNRPVLDESWRKEDRNSYAPKKTMGQEKEPRQAFSYFGEAEPVRRENTFRDFQAPEEKTGIGKYLHLLVCLVFILGAAASLAGTVFLVGMQKKEAVGEHRESSYEESAEADQLGYIACYDNGVVFLEDVAYTVYDTGTYPINPSKKLIAIFVEAFSERYEMGHYSMAQCYVGYDTPYGRSYAGTANQDQLIPYVVAHGYSPEQMLSAYGIANGANETGCYFFYVPQEVTDLTLYCEQREKEKGVTRIQKVYTKSYQVLPAGAGQ